MDLKTRKKKYLRSTDPVDLLQVIKINPVSISYSRISISGKTKKVRAGHLRKSTAAGLVLIEFSGSHKGEPFSSCVYASSTKSLGNFIEKLECKEEPFDKIVDICGDAIHLTFLQCSEALGIKLAEILRPAVRRNLRYATRLTGLAPST